MSKSADILEQARALYRSAEGSYRDALLQVGNLMHEYIYEKLKEGSEHHILKRQRLGLTRHNAMKECVAQLGIERGRMSILIATAMAVKLLSDNGHVGDLSHSCLVWFARCVQRKSDINTPSRKDSVLLFEEWEVKPEFVGAQEAFRRAVNENLKRPQIRELTLALGKGKWNSGNYHAHIKMTKEREEALTVLQSIAKVGTPRDVAELIFEAIKDSSDPKTLAACLQQLVSKPRKKAPSLYELAEA